MCPTIKISTNMQTWHIYFVCNMPISCKNINNHMHLFLWTCADVQKVIMNTNDAFELVIIHSVPIYRNWSYIPSICKTICMDTWTIINWFKNMKMKYNYSIWTTQSSSLNYMYIIILPLYRKPNEIFQFAQNYIHYNVYKIL